MIPKVINYVWLGQGKKSNLSHICINSWKTVLEDYEIIEWNEDKLDLEEIASQNKFFAECRKRKLWAYMADYLRLYILYEYGGIYLDTDVQVLKKFDDLLDKKMFLGYEAYGKFLGTGIIAAEPHHPAIKVFLDFYQSEIWKVDFYTIPIIFNYVMEKKPEAFSDVSIYSKDYFSPYDYKAEYSESMITENTYSIHWYDGTWKNNPQVGLFLQTKHIRNPLKKRIIQVKKILGHLRRKFKAWEKL